jgi:bacterioferritin-associated ferredoxin
MIICVCKNISEQKIIQEIQNGSSFDDLQINLGVAMRCGSCMQCIHSLIKDNISNLKENSTTKID